MGNFLNTFKIKKKLFLIAVQVLIIFIFLFYLSSLRAEGQTNKATNKAVNGFLDLSSTSEYMNSDVEIKGGWLFFNSIFLNPQDISDNQIPEVSGVVDFPGIQLLVRVMLE